VISALRFHKTVMASAPPGLARLAKHCCVLGVPAMCGIPVSFERWNPGDQTKSRCCAGTVSDYSTHTVQGSSIESTVEEGPAKVPVLWDSADTLRRPQAPSLASGPCTDQVPFAVDAASRCKDEYNCPNRELRNVIGKPR
jgi:hypothetical protein